MFVCVCCGVRDRDIREAIAEGADSRRAVAEAVCGAGSKCGRCCEAIDEMLADAEVGYASATLYCPQPA